MICANCGKVVMQGQSHRWTGGKAYHLPDCVKRVVCSVCGFTNSHSHSCYASDTTKLMDEVDATTAAKESRDGH